MELKEDEKHFVKNLIKWNKNDNKRVMPWKGEKDPYKIWLSEIILQQTRVDQGLNYYHRFIVEFPTVKDLAQATETTVFKLWEGLGYYTRCKNLIATAKYIQDELNGVFPNEYDKILSLKGIGPYTAAAIASFAYNLPYAVVDGNVYRVLARYFGIFTPTDSTAGKKKYNELANRLLDKNNPAAYNQALMDFGAIICKPQIPLCASCIMNKNCSAFLNNTVQQLPVKEKQIKKKTRWFYYLIVNYEGKVYIRKRGAKDIWENLYEFILIETDESMLFEHLPQVKEIFGTTKFEVENISALSKQLLTHQTINGQFIGINIKNPISINGFEAVDYEALQKLPFPKLISNYLKDKNVSLNLF